MIKILEKTKCCGCQACEQRCPKHCISMEQDAEGFFYPVVNVDLCVNCGICEKVCPIQRPYDEKSPIKSIVAINRDLPTRKKSSSGGIFSAIAAQVLKRDGVVFGTCYDENWQAQIGFIESQKDLYLLQGSKYIQSRTGNSYTKCEKFLKEGRVVLFSGTPCQIAGLKHYLRIDYETLLTCDVVCHGCPSPGVWAAYLKEEVGNLADLKNISFRNKQNGWKRFNFAMSYKEKASIVEYHRDNVYMRAFLSNLILRPSCYHCRAKEGRSHSDFTLADYWNVSQFHPEMDDDIGTSLVLINTAKGLDIFKSMDIEYKDTILENAALFNAGLKPNAFCHPDREKFFRKFENGESVKNSIERCLKRSLLHRLKKKVLSKIMNWKK